MSQENIKLIYLALDAVNQRDVDAFLALMDEEVEAVSRIVAIEGGLHGHRGVRRWWDSWFEAFPDYHLEIVEARDLGDAVVATFRALGHGAGSELPFEDNAWHASRWRDGKCVWWQVFYTETDALEAVGLREEQAVSHANVELVRRGVQSLQAFWAMLDEYVVWDLRETPLPDLDGVYVGRDAVIKASRHYWGTWDEYKLDVEELIDAGSSVVVVLHEQGRGKGSGAPFEQRLAQVWTFHRGRVIRWELFPDKATALEAAGLKG